MSETYFFRTMGCQMNVYDSQKMANLLEMHLGMRPTEDEESAQCLVLNTCAIREGAQERVFHQLGRWRVLKEANPNILIVVTGCVASQEGAVIIKRAPYVDVVLGPQTIHRLPELIRQVKSKGKSVVDISFPEIEKFDSLPEPKAEGVKAFVSIMEGCDKYCSYCVVPYTRGTEISRPFEDVLTECASLVEQGVKEITLLGQNVNHYLGKGQDGSVTDLAELIRYLAAIDGLGRLRFMTSHPVEFSDALIQAYQDVDILANHLHLPVQSGSDRILSLMKRNHTALEYKSKIRKLRKVRPDICISTDIIVGFPGETDQDFEATMKLVKDVGFDQSFSFIYSRRPGTPAADFADETPMEVKKQRLDILQHQLSLQGRIISENMVGTTQMVLVDSVSRKDEQEMSGRTENNRIVNFKANPRLLGHFVPVTITEVLTTSLRGVLNTA